MSPKPDLRGLLADQGGIALISSLLFTLLMTLVVIALAYRVQLFSVGTRDNVVKSQNLYTADVGLNQARYFFLDKDCAMVTLDSWKCSNGGLTITDKYTEISRLFSGTFIGNQPFPISESRSVLLDSSTTSLTTTSGDEYTYKVYAKASGIQDVISIVTVAERPGNPAKTVIDAAVKYNVKLGDDSIRTKNQGADGSGNSKEALGDADSSTVRNTISGSQ